MAELLSNEQYLTWLITALHSGKPGAKSVVDVVKLRLLPSLRPKVSK
jgi:hypothetical protein